MQDSILRKSAITLGLGSIIMVIVFGILWFKDSKQIHTLILATGDKSGQYYAFGKALSKVVNNHNPQIKIKVLESQGSPANAELLDNNSAQLALVQSDTVVNPSTKAITFLFPELFHLIVKKNAGIKK